MQAHLSGDGTFTKRCQTWMEEHFGVRRALLTHSCTAALEMAALLCDVGPGDEVIMPSFTFSSTRHRLRAARRHPPVFVDIRPDNCNLDETLLPGAITPPHQGDRAGPLRGRVLRDGHDHGPGPGPWPARGRGRGPGVFSPPTRAACWAVSAISVA